MKITVWMSERSLEQFKNKERVTGMISNREPGTHVDVFQVQLTLDEYYQLKDVECCGTGCCDSVDLETDQVTTQWSCSLPEGAEWDVSYSLEDGPIECSCTDDFHCSCSDPVEDKSVPTFADVYDITRATPNDMELGRIIRNMVNDSDE